MKKYYLGLDVGGTKIEAALLEVSDQNGPNSTPLPFANSEGYFRILERERTPTNRDRGYKPVIETIAKLSIEICHKANIPFEKLEGIGMGLPGTIHPTRQVMLNGNTQILIEMPLIDDLNKLFPTKVHIICENDANCFALAEVLAGAGVDYFRETKIAPEKQTAIGIILGTGCGGGIIFNGQIITGANGGGGEIGHSELYTNGLLCYCKKRGCAEQYLSGSGIEKKYQQKTDKKINGKEIFALAQKNDPMATEVLQEYETDLAKFLTNLTNIFDPHYFVLGGGVSNQDQIYAPVQKLLSTTCFVPAAQPKIYKHRLGDSAGVIGAALLLLKR